MQRGRLPFGPMPEWMGKIVREVSVSFCSFCLIQVPIIRS